MDYLITYSCLTIMLSYVECEPCSISATPCHFQVTCTELIDEPFNWYSFTMQGDRSFSYQGISCHETFEYVGQVVYTVELIIRRNFMTDHSFEPVPRSIYTENENFFNIIRILNLSNNYYYDTPTINNMVNLVLLNISRNHLTTAVLSNHNELNLLTEIDLSYNTISDIKVNSYEYPYKMLTKIDMSHNLLVKIPDIIFDDFEDLQILDLSYNYLQSLNQATFEGIRKMSDLNLSNNKLRSINSSLFRFKVLKILNVRDNKIDTLKPDDFEQLVQLKTLDLSLNMITTIPANVFNTTVLLKNLYLNDNLLEVIDKNSFSNLQSLRSINLSNNKIKSLPVGLFKETACIDFSITENRLEGSLIKGMFDGVNSTELNLSNQLLSELADNAFYDLLLLDTLLLYANSITHLSNKCFSTLINLQTLDLSNNQITSITFDTKDLKSLKCLLFKKNYLTDIKYEQLQYLYNLELLDISENQITRLEPMSFLSLKSLTNLELDSNSLSGILETGTFSGLLLLYRLDISHSKLTIISNTSFNDMNMLREVNMSYCNISELEYNVFNHTGHIEILDLSYNKLQEFFVNTTELINLSMLLLSNNLIKMISSSTLLGLVQLSKIVLSHNSIENIHNESFNNLDNLQDLDLSDNERLYFNTSIIKNNKKLNSLILSKTKIKLVGLFNLENLPIADLATSYAGIQNISQLNFGVRAQLISLDLSFNNISRLFVGDFSNITTLRSLNLSFNKISFVQPGIFNNNSELSFLNISHNCLSSVGYGSFSGLYNLNVLDMAYNNIKDLQGERFHELNQLSILIVDFNQIKSININDFGKLSEISLGNNPLPCEILVKINKKQTNLKITAIRLDAHSNENVNGVACHSDHNTALRVDKAGENNDVLNVLRNILYNITESNTQKNTETQYLDKISYILEKSDGKLTNLINLTNIFIALNNNTNTLLSNIIKTSDKSVTNAPVTPKPEIIHLTAPLKENNIYLNETKNDVSLKSNVEIGIRDTIETKNNLKEIENKLALYSHQIESLSTSYDKLMTNHGKESAIVESCVVSMLLILVALVVHKCYKTFKSNRNRYSCSTRELVRDLENSSL